MRDAKPRKILLCYVCDSLMQLLVLACIDRGALHCALIGGIDMVFYKFLQQRFGFFFHKQW